MVLALERLSDAQRTAVTWDAASPLQILAGPGSGKTRVLTTRVAWLVLGDEHRPPVDPSRCVVVTFTNKAANEMRERLHALIGEEKTQKLVLGTFHSTCARILRRWGRRIGVDANFTIADMDDVKRIVKETIEAHEAAWAAEDITLKPDHVLTQISRAKSRCQTPAEFRTRLKAPPGSASAHAHAATAQVYEEYQQQLRACNALDFDDLLMLGAQLFLLVDEFQDTNAVQYELMRLMASSCRCVSVVGDPDQSIYSRLYHLTAGWRNAEVGNLEAMSRDFPGVRRVLLEENYRSTKSILQAAVQVMRQDTQRIDKDLFTTHTQGAPVMVRSCADAEEEADFLAHEIARQVQCSKGLLTYADVCILLRFNALSRTMEGALQRLGIPYRIMGGMRFFDRAEIKDLLAYLLVVDNPQYSPGVVRIINVPRRGIGDKGIQSLLRMAEEARMPLLPWMERAAAQPTVGLRPTVLQAIRSFVHSIEQVRQAAKQVRMSYLLQNMPVAELLQLLLREIRYEEHLRRDEDFESRWENVQELISFASSADATQHEPTSDSSPLRAFLESSSLASEASGSETATHKVTISTCHAAKGLEWPIVFLPASEEGTYPFYRCTTPDEIREERRLYYVAMTRAQTHLYLTYAERRRVAGEWGARMLTPFLAPLLPKERGGTLPRGAVPKVPWNYDVPALHHAGLTSVATMLQRPPLTEATVSAQCQAFAQSALARRFHTCTKKRAAPSERSESTRPATGFVSALNSLGASSLGSTTRTDGTVRATTMRPGMLGTRPRTLGLGRPRLGALPRVTRKDA